MPYDGLMDDLRKVVACDVPSRVPFLALSEEFDVKWYDRGTYQEITDDPQKLADCWSAAIDEFGYDWAWMQVDDCFEFEPLGVGVKGEGNILRATCDYLPATRETLDSLQKFDPKTAGRIPVLLEAITKLRDRFGDTVCVTGRVAAPFTSTALLYGIEETMVLTITDADLVHQTNAFLLELQASFCQAQYDAGAHAIWVGDCNAMSNLISLAHFNEFAFQPCADLAAKCRDMGVLTFLHNSEVKTPYVERQVDLGVDIISVGPEADIAECRRVTKTKSALSGHLDPVNVLQNGTVDDVIAQAEEIFAICKPGGGYAFNSGEMIPRDTPVENMRAMAETARRLGAY